MKNTPLLSVIVLVILSVAIGLWTLREPEPVLGATILTTNSSDTLGTFRTNVNTSLTNLNNALAGLLATSSISATYPVQWNSSTAVMSLAFGTTTSNTWASTQTFDNITATGATTTTLSTGNASTTNLWISGTRSAVLLTSSTGAVSGASATTCTNQFVRAMSALYAATCNTVDISSDTNLTVSYPIVLTNDALSLALSTTTSNTWAGTQTFGNTVTTNATTTSLYIGSGSGILEVVSGQVGIATAGTDYQGALTFTYPLTNNANAIGLALATTSSNTWASTQTFGNISATGATTTTLSTGVASTTSLFVSGVRSAVLLTSSIGAVSGASATTCTNQFVRAMSAAYVATCASINNADWSGTDLSVANGGTGLSTFGGANHVLYTTAADTLSSEAAFTYTASTDNLTVVNASTTRITASTGIWGDFASGVWVSDANKKAAAATAQTCTNQFVRAMSASYIATCATVDISSDTNLTAGRSLTLNSDTVDADAEVYTDSRAFNYASSSLATTTGAVLSWKIPQAATISTITCWSHGTGTTTVQFEERTAPNTAGTDVLYSPGILAGAHVVTASSTISNNSMASGNYLAMVIEGYLLGSPTNPVCDVKFTYDD